MVSLGELVDVSALGRLVIAVSAPGDIFFVLFLFVEEELFFQLELVVAQLLESGRAALVLLTLTVVYLLFPLGNGILHALFVEAARTTSLGSLVLCHLIGISAFLILGRTLFHGLALGKQILSFFCFILTRI